MSWQELLDEAEQALDEARYRDALQLCDRAAQSGEDARYCSVILRGDTLLEMGEAAAALSAYDSVADLDTIDPELDCARGIALFELCRLPEAENALESAIRDAPELAEAYFTLALIAELRGSGDEELFRKARLLQPERYPSMTRISPGEFDGVVEQALDELPEPVQRALDNIPIIVQELPDLDVLRETDPPMSPACLGMYMGVPPSELSVMDPVNGPPAAIILFKRNLERAFNDRSRLVAEIRTTLLHEVGHALGLSEADLEDRGLE